MIVPLAKAKVSIVAETGQFNKDIDSTKKKITDIGVETDKITKISKKAWDSVSAGVKNTTDHLNSMRGAILALGVGYAAKRIAADFLSVAESFEAMEVQLDVLTKGMGKKTLDDLNKWALDMPVNTAKAVDSFRLMTAMGLDPTIKTIETLTDVASIFGEDVLQRLALQLGQASAKGKIMAQDLNIMAEAGINARKYLFDAFGMTVEELQNSSIDIKDIIKVIFDGMATDFGGAAKKMMSSWRGLKTVTKSYFVEIEKSIMDAGVFDELKSSLSGFNDEMKTWLDANRELIKTDVPKYIEEFKDSAQKLWDIISYDPAIIEYGLLGLAIGGKKGAVVLGGLAHLAGAFSNQLKAIKAISAGDISFFDFASSGFKELEEILEKVEAGGFAEQTLKNRIEDVKNELLSMQAQFAKAEKNDWFIAMFDPKRLDGFSKAINEKKEEIEFLNKQLEDLRNKKIDVPVVVDFVATGENPFEEEIERVAAKKMAQERIETARLKLITGKQNDAAEKYYAEHLDKMAATTEQYNDFILDSMDKTTEKYQSAYIDSEMKKWARVYGITQEQLDKINFEILDSLKETEEETEGIFGGIVENFTSSVQSSMTGLFSDALKGDLKTAEDYFTKFTDSLIDIWASAMSKMVMEQIMATAATPKTSGGQQAGEGAAGGAMAGGAWGAVIGLGLAGISKVLGDRAQEKAEQKQRERLMLQTQQQVENSIAQLELSDLDYEIFQMNKRFEDLVDIARKTKMPLDDIIKLRNLETKAIMEQATAGYRNLQGNITDFITGRERQTWTVSDWLRELGNLSDDLMQLDNTQDTYNDESLKILTEQFEILKNIKAIEENQLRNLESTSKSLVSQALGLQTSEGMPISREYFEGRYNELLSAALTPGADGMLNTSDIAFFQGFASDYIDAMSTLGDDYNVLNSRVSDDLLYINELVQSEMNILTEALGINTDAVDHNTDAIILQLESLKESIEDISKQERIDKWFDAKPPKSTGMDTGFDWSPATGSISGDQLANKEMFQQYIAWGRQGEGLALYKGWLDAGVETGTISASDYDRWAGWLNRFPTTTDMSLSDVWDPVLQGDRQQWQQDKPEDFPGFAMGGLATGIGVIGETGQPEWAVPAWNNSNNANFMRSVGMDQVLNEVRNSNKAPIEITLNVDGRQIAYTIVDQSRKNPELKQMLMRN